MGKLRIFVNGLFMFSAHERRKSGKAEKKLCRVIWIASQGKM